jgi:hypothetical protein
LSSEQEYTLATYNDIAFSDFVIVGSDLFDVITEELLAYNHYPDTALMAFINEINGRESILYRLRPILYIFDFHRIIYDEFQVYGDSDFFWVADNLKSDKIWFTSKSIDEQVRGIEFISRYISNYHLLHIPLESSGMFRKFIRYSPSRSENIYIQKNVRIEPSMIENSFDPEKPDWGMFKNQIQVTTKSVLKKYFESKKVPYDLDKTECFICNDSDTDNGNSTCGTSVYNSCGHKFCHLCVEKWGVHCQYPVCPLCRTDMRTLFAVEKPNYYTNKTLGLLQQIENDKYSLNKTILYCSNRNTAFDLHNILISEKIPSFVCVGTSNYRMGLLSKFVKKMRSQVLIVSDMNDIAGYDFKFVKSIMFWDNPSEFTKKLLINSCIVNSSICVINFVFSKSNGDVNNSNN